MKLYYQAIKCNDDPYDLSTDDLYEYIEMISTKALEYGWYDDVA